MIAEYSEVGISLIISVIALTIAIFGIIKIFRSYFTLITIIFTLAGIIVGSIFITKTINGIDKFGGIFITSETEAEVISVGYGGIVIEFENEFGDVEYSETLKLENPQEYYKGDTITISITKCVFLKYPTTISVKDNE